MSNGPKVITCTGYGGTGSSVVSDLLAEFDTICSFGNFEFRFIQDPHGLRDLDYGIVENNNRLSTSYHINNFKKYVNYLSKSKVYPYEKFFNGNFKKITDEYLSNIIDVSWDGFWHQDIIDESPLKKLAYYSERFYQKKILRMKEGGAELYGSLSKKKMYYSYSSDKFYLETKKYIRSLINTSNYYDNEYVVFDQIIPPNDTEHYLRYFDDIRVIIVDRDPRDLYLINKCQWNEKWIPTEDVDTYIKWFKVLREHQKYDNENPKKVLRLPFEDFIYDYDKTVELVADFIGVNNSFHTKPKTIFNPDVSIKNTNLKLIYPEMKSDIEKIESELSEFCYKF
ncbi:hypothetical protein UA38_12670 [Photobacterium kishitanii]|uniref:Sulfotransferase family protein n=1 Tax=Photobacterium kishitanii TaxID=318456 RepID=A0AAX0YYW4_9GAMM|nr:sulfotransferase [Photobacterium kishitanii]KJG56829.1 hypothetical protein UA38_12670 [Photobacterium kishitanii]KJG60431.1 hypothetical protein UA42_15705 [Photobacterium kishitanii]KJG64715.1 hypothetical protein UA40_15425 [Photobacterium kishitanii]KJG68928.1 hypothetical protein UA41_14560 [Photobacterium kishitanii]PSX18813.1 hypothetical protein C0W70_12465 [Photobacterium kishitanii]